MNSYDRENLTFLLNATPELLQEWYNTVNEDDRAYASEILDAYSKELALRQRFNAVEEFNLEQEYMLPDAKEYLSKFRLRK